MIILSLSGRMRSGKDTVADIIEQALNDWIIPLKYQRIAFADSLYNEVAKATGCKVEYIKEHKDNFRLILQGWGTNYRRELCDKEYWVKKVFEKINNLDTSSFIVVTDTRFLNEYLPLTSVGAETWRVIRPMSSLIDLHPSETELTDDMNWDMIIKNDFDKGYLTQIVKEKLSDLLKKKGLMK